MAYLPSRQIVRLTRCLGVRGHPVMLIEMMSFIGYRWYPEYIVEEQFLDFNQTQFHYIVRIYPHHTGVTRPIHSRHGIGMTENMAVQDAAYSRMTLLREEHAMLGGTPFAISLRHFQEKRDTTLGCTQITLWRILCFR